MIERPKTVIIGVIFLYVFDAIIAGLLVASNVLPDRNLPDLT